MSCGAAASAQKIYAAIERLPKGNVLCCLCSVLYHYLCARLRVGCERVIIYKVLTMY